MSTAGHDDRPRRLTSQSHLDVEHAAPTRVFWRWGAATVVALAFGIRLVGIGWALPYVHHSDEPTSLRVVQTMVRDRTVNPHFFAWPSLPFYIQAVPYLSYGAFGIATDQFDSLDEISLPDKQNIGSVLLHNPKTLLVARLTTVVFSLGIVAAGIWLVSRVTGKLWAGALAGVLLAVDPLLVTHARWMTPDTFAALFAILAVTQAVRALDSGRMYHYVLAGGFVGLAASCKYNVAVAGLVIVATALVRHGWAGLLKPGLHAAGLAAVVAFLITTPAVLFAPGEVTDALRFVFDHNAAGHPGAEGGQVLFYSGALVRDLGPLLLLLPFAFMSTTRRASLVIASLPIAMGLVLLPFPVRWERYLLPAIPALIALAVIGGGNAYALIRGRWGTRVAQTAAMTTLGVALVLSTVAIAQEWNRLSTDHRREAQTWFYANAAAGASVMVDGYAPWIDPERYSVSANGLVLEHDRVFEVEPQFVFLTERGSGRFRVDGGTRYPLEAARYDRLLGAYCPVAQFAGPEPMEILSRGPCDR